MSVVLSGVSVVQILGMAVVVIALLLGSVILAGELSRSGRGLTLGRNDLPARWFDRYGRPVPVTVAKSTPRAPPVEASWDLVPDAPDPTSVHRRGRSFSDRI